MHPAALRSRRLANAETDLQAHAKSISALVDELGKANQRIHAIEEARAQRQVLEARMEEREAARDAALDVRLKAIEESLKETRDDVKAIKGFGWKMIGVVTAAIVLAFVAFVIRGGLAPP